LVNLLEDLPAKLELQIVDIAIEPSAINNQSMTRGNNKLLVLSAATATIRDRLSIPLWRVFVLASAAN